MRTGRTFSRCGPKTFGYGGGKVEKVIVDSSAIDFMTYDRQEQKLYVRFVNGLHYVYNAVQAQTFEQMKTAKSVGLFFHQHVRGQHRCREIPSSG